MSNPINIQAQRILNLLAEMKDKFNYLVWVTPEFLNAVTKQKDQLSDAFDPKIITMLVGHMKFEDEYKQLYEEIKAAAEVEDPEPEEEEGRNKEQDLQNLSELIKRIKRSIRNVLRYFYEHPDNFNNLKDIVGTKRSSKINEFVNLFVNHFEICRQRMTTSKEEEDSKAEQLKLLEAKIVKLRNEKTVKDKNLKAQKKNREDFLSETKAEIERLRNEITSTKESRESELKQLKEDTERKLKDNEEDHKRNMEKLETERKKKMDELKVLIDSNKNEEEKNRGLLSSQIRQQFNEKIDEYDKMMKERNKDKEDQEKLLREEMKILDDKKRMLKEIKESNFMFQQEEEDFKKQLEQHNMLIEAKAQATLWIQAHWRGHKVRTEKKKR